MNFHQIFNGHWPCNEKHYLPVYRLLDVVCLYFAVTDLRLVCCWSGRP